MSESKNDFAKEKPLVSVIMATYNEKPEIIALAIESILQQTYGYFELLIYDDSTCLETRKMIDLYSKDARIVIHRERKRVGFVKSLNMGLKEAKGKYIARMDGDDVSVPERFQKEVEYLERHKDISVIGGYIRTIDENGNKLSVRRYPLKGIGLSLYSTVRCPVAHPTVMMRREIVDDGLYYDEGLDRVEDLDLWLRLMNRSYRIANLDEVLLNYRVSCDFSQKRSCREQKVCMARVRKKNFSWKRPVYSILSYIFADIFLLAPSGIIKDIYGLRKGE